jgi:hypothetical protein
MYDVAALLELVPPADRLAAAQSLVEAVIAVDPAAMSDVGLTEQVLAGAALGERVAALTTLTVGVWEPRKTWTASNARSARAWLAAQGDLGSAHAGRLLRCGRVAQHHPVVGSALGSGRLSCRKVELFADAVAGRRDIVFARDAALLVDHVCSLGHVDAAALVGRWKMLADDAISNEDDEAQVEGRHLHHSRVGNRYRCDGSFDLEAGAIIDAALRDAMDGPDSPDREGGQRNAGQRRCDALTKVCEHWLGSRNAGKGANPVATVNLHVDPDTLFGSCDDGFDVEAVCDLYPGGPVPRTVAWRLLLRSYVGAV